MQSFEHLLGTQHTPRIPEVDPTEIPFQEMATPDPCDALFALRAVQLGLAANTSETPSSVAEGTVEKLHARACAAMTRATLDSARLTLDLEPVARIDSVNLLVGQQIISLEVTQDEVDAVAHRRKIFLSLPAPMLLLNHPTS